MKRRSARLISLALLALGALLAGCDGDGGGPSAPAGPDPATVTPADAPLFAEGVVRPDGDRKEALESALSKLLATDDPGSFIVQQIDKSLAADAEGLTYEDDIEPWLGEQAGVFIEAFTENADAAVVIATTDSQAAKEAIEAFAAADKVPERRRSYEGVDYLVDRDGAAAGVLGDFVVGGDENAFRDAVDASRGESLAEAPGFRTQLDQAPEDRVGFAYADPRALVDALEEAGLVTSAQVSSAGPQLDALLSEPVVAFISATSDELTLQASAAAGAAPASTESPLLRDFPDDAWFAFAVPDAGQTFADLLNQIQESPGSAHPSLDGGLGLDLSTEVSGWAGDFGGFVAGTSLFGLSGALVLETGDEQASARTLDRLQRLLGNQEGLSVQPLTDDGDTGFSLTPAGVPIEFRVVQRDGKVVAGPADAVEDVLSPSSTLEDADAFNSAVDALGEDFAPAAFVDFVPLLELVDSFPQVQSDPDYRSAKPYLDHLDYFVLGGRRDEDRAELKMVLGLRDAPAETGGTPERPRRWWARSETAGAAELVRGRRPAGIGIDLLEIARLERALERWPRLAERLFTDGELAEARSRRRPGRHLAARFAAKEAALKALGGEALAPREIELRGGGREAPWLRLHGRAARVAGDRGVELQVSLTHSRELAAAAVLAVPAAPGPRSSR